MNHRAMISAWLRAKVFGLYQLGSWWVRSLLTFTFEWAIVPHWYTLRHQSLAHHMVAVILLLRAMGVVFNGKVLGSPICIIDNRYLPFGIVHVFLNWWHQLVHIEFLSLGAYLVHECLLALDNSTLRDWHLRSLLKTLWLLAVSFLAMVVYLVDVSC